MTKKLVQVFVVAILLVCGLDAVNGCTNGSLQLEQTATSDLESVVQVCVNSHWRAICICVPRSSSWDSNAARVVCNYLMCPGTDPTIINLKRNITDVQLVRTTRFNCTGNESTLVGENGCIGLERVRPANDCDIIVGLKYEDESYSDQTTDQTPDQSASDPISEENVTTSSPEDDITEATQGEGGTNQPQKRPALQFTSIELKQNINSHYSLEFSWSVHTSIPTNNSSFYLECRDINNPKERKKGEEYTRNSAFVNGLKFKRSYNCCIKAQASKLVCLDTIMVSPPHILTTRPPASPRGQESAQGLTTLGVAVGLFILMVIVWVGIGIAMCRRRQGSFSPSKYEIYNPQQQSPVLSNVNMQHHSMPLPPTNYNALDHTYELLPEPTYEHIHQALAKSTSVNSTAGSGAVTRVSHDQEYHVLECNNMHTSGSGLLQDQRDQESSQGDDSEDHTYQVLEDPTQSREGSAEPCDKPEKLNLKREEKKENQTLSHSIIVVEKATTEHNCPLTELIEEEPQEYEVPTGSQPSHVQ